MNKNLLIITWSVLMLPELSAQSKLGVENYQYWSQPGGGSIVPILHFHTGNNWYAELRYNYEDERTLSLFTGRSFKGGNKMAFQLIPLVGYSTGVFSGVSIGLNADIDWEKLYLSSQSQFSKANQGNDGNFFFSWSEAGHSIGEHFFAGIAGQYTCDAVVSVFQAGLLAGVTIKDFSFPVYVFMPFSNDRFFILGVNYEYSFKKKKTIKP